MLYIEDVYLEEGKAYDLPSGNSQSTLGREGRKKGNRRSYSNIWPKQYVVNHGLK